MNYRSASIGLCIILATAAMAQTPESATDRAGATRAATGRAGRHAGAAERSSWLARREGGGAPRAAAAAERRLAATAAACGVAAAAAALRARGTATGRAGAAAAASADADQAGRAAAGGRCGQAAADAHPRSAEAGSRRARRRDIGDEPGGGPHPSAPAADGAGAVRAGEPARPVREPTLRGVRNPPAESDQPPAVPVRTPK